MSCNINPSNINQTFIIEPLSITGGTPTISACTAIYSDSLISCSGNTTIFMGNGTISFNGNLYTNQNISASTINASTFVSGGTNLLNIMSAGNITGGTFNNSTDTLTLYKPSGQINITGLTDYYTTGATLIGNTVYFNRTDTLSAYTLSLSALPTSNTYTTGLTFSNNQIIITRNDGVSLNVFVNTFTGLTVNGSLYANQISATTYYGDGSNLTGIANTYVTGSTLTNKILELTRNDNNFIDVLLPFRLLTTASTTTTSNSFITIDVVTGITNNSNSFVVSYISAYKDNIDYGFWKRTLAINKLSGLVSIIGENSDFDRVSSGLTASNIVYSGIGGDLEIKISGETSKSYTWSSNWEIIK